MCLRVMTFAPLCVCVCFGVRTLASVYVFSLVDMFVTYMYIYINIYMSI